MSLVSNAVPSGPVVENAVEVELRDQIRRMQSSFDRAGLLGTGAPISSARQWVSRLTGQGDDEAVDQTPGQVYLTTHNLSEDEPVVAAAQIITDFELARQEVEQVDAVAIRFGEIATSLSRDALTIDLDHVERAMTYAQQALGTLDEAAASIESSVGTTLQTNLSERRQAYVDASERLRDHADSLSRLRHDMRNDAAS